MIDRFDLRDGNSISRIIKGGWQLASGHSEAASADPIGDMSAFVEAGIDTFDCADIYTGVESIIGAFLERHRAEGGATGVRVHTKYVPDIDRLGSLGKVDVERVIDRSRERLRQDRLDMVQFHWWDTSVPGYLEAAGWLDELRRAGKIDQLSLTNFNTAVTRELLDTGIPIVTTQVQYSLLDARPAKGLAELCAAHDMNLLCYGTLAGGFLSERWLGKVDPLSSGTGLENRSLTKYRLVIEEVGGWDAFQALLEVLNAVGRRHGVSLSSVASRWVLEQPGVAAVIVGARNASHLARYAEWFSFELGDADLAEIETARVELTAVPGDVFDLERDRSGRHGHIMKYNLNEGG